MSAAASARRLAHPVLFICDLQDKFRGPIAHFPAVLATTQKLLRAAAALKIPIVATTQSRAKLGETCAELELGSTYPLVADVDKTAFSMWLPAVTGALAKLPGPAIDTNTANKMGRGGPYDVIIVGIETHICVLQTTLDALRAGSRVWVVQDGVSSCNEGERGVALARMRQEGARVTTSESLMYEMMGDAKDEAFRDIARIVKEAKDSTREGLEKLCKM